MPEQPGSILTRHRAFIRGYSCRYLTGDKTLTACWHDAGMYFISFTLFLQQMYFSVKRLFLLLRQSALLLVYAAFFLVQFFCITGSDNTTAIPVAVVSHYKEPVKEKIFTAKNDHSKKTKIRLNKRFQPAIADGILYAGEDVPIKYINCNNLSKAKDYLLISFILAASLRGPPGLS